MTQDDLPLAAEFPTATRDQWRKLVDEVLKGAPFERKLIAKTYDGLRIEPLYAGDATAHAVAARAAAAPWQVTARIDHPDPAAANAEALNELDSGATGLSLIFAGSVGAYGFGLDPSPAAIDRVLEGVHLDAGIALDLDLAWNATEAPAHIAALVKRRRLDPATLDFRMNFDPIGALATGGSSLVDWSTLGPRFAAMIAEFTEQGFRGPFALADGRIVHAAGGSEAQELAYALSAGVAYLRTFAAGGVALDTARKMVSFRLTADADEFLSLAKLRALRKLWARVEGACGLTPQPAFVAAETAWRTMTQRDPWVNILRGTVAAVAAGLGGADAITVLPFTNALGLPDRFARRIARNTQLILLEESSLAKVSDPAAGSGGIEDMTRQLCAAAWTLFQEIEKAGGAWSALEKGFIQEKVATVRAERQAAVARGRDALTGLSAYPDIHELPVAVLDVTPILPAVPGDSDVTATPLPRLRLAEPFEALRDASDRALAATGSRPKVFLANLGTLSDFTPRATFAKNFFEAGGIEAISNDGFASHADLAAAFKASGAKLACLCSSDAVYAGEAEAVAKALAAAGATHLYLAGRPGELAQSFSAAGIKEFIYFGCNSLAVLHEAYAVISAENSTRAQL